MLDGSSQLQRRASLGFADQLVLWSARLWVVGFKRQVAVTGQLEAAYSRVGAVAAARLVDRFMSVLGHGASRTIDIACVCAAWVSDDERRILGLIARHQSCANVAAPWNLRGFLTPTAARVAAELARRLAQTLAEAGLRLQQPKLPPAPATAAPLWPRATSVH